MLRLAREYDIKTAESRIETVGGKDVLLVERFDREKTAKGYTRARMVSGLTILRADEAPEARQNWSYVILVEELRRIVEDAKKDARPSVVSEKDAETIRGAFGYPGFSL
jgi:serine/threonine-protein kinase HipA